MSQREHLMNQQQQRQQHQREMENQSSSLRSSSSPNSSHNNNSRNLVVDEDDDHIEDPRLSQQQGGRNNNAADFAGEEPPISFREVALYSLRSYVFALAGDLVSKLFVAPLERLNVLHQTDLDIQACGIRRNLGGLTKAYSTMRAFSITNTVWSALVMQFWRTTFRTFTSFGFYLLEPLAAGRMIGNPTYYFYFRPVLIDVLNLLCVYPIDTAATIAMADDPDQPVYESSFDLIKRVVAKPSDSLRGFWITAAGLVVYRGLLSGTTRLLMDRELIPDGLVGRFLLQNGVFIACTTIVYPFDVIRRRMLVRQAFSKALSSRKHAAAADASASLLAATTTTSSSASAGDLQNNNKKEQKEGEATTTASSASGSLDASSSSSSTTSSSAEGTIVTIQRIYQEEGASGFFRGLDVRLLRMFFGTAFFGFLSVMEYRSMVASE